MAQTIHPPHVRCPDCGAEATLLPDGAIYCPAENCIAQRFPADPPHPGGADGAGAGHHHRHHIDLDVSAERVRREYGLFNLALLALVLVALAAAGAAFALVL
jgi:hypothetical protein